MKELENHVDIRGTQPESRARGRAAALLMESSRPAGVFYGWWIVAAAFLNLFFAVGIIFYGFPVFYPALVQGLGFTRAQITQGFQLGFLVAGLPFGFLAGTVIDKVGPDHSFRSGTHQRTTPAYGDYDQVLAVRAALRAGDFGVRDGGSVSGIRRAHRRTTLDCDAGSERKRDACHLP